MCTIPWRLFAASVLTAALLDLPFPLAGPLPPWRAIFAWVALVPLLVAILRQAHNSRRLLRTFAAGWLTGALWFGSNCYWVYNTMHTYGSMGALMAAVCLLLFSLYLGFWFGAFSLILGLLRRATLGKRTAWIPFAAIPILWTTMEFALARIPEFPWDQLGYSQVDNQFLTQLAPWTGVYGITFVLAGVNALLTAGLVLERGQTRFSARRSCGFLGVSVAFTCALGIFIKPPQPPVQATAILVQPNLDVISDDVWVGPEWDRHLAQFAQLAAQSCAKQHIAQYIAGIPETDAHIGQVECGPNPAPPALILWPESPAPFRDQDPRFQSAMASIAKANQAPMIVGNIGMDADRNQQYQIYNSASVIAQDGHFFGRYDKIHLVPFGEYVPFRRLLFFAHQLTQNLSDLSIGTDRKTFRINSQGNGAHRYGIFICYESVFGDEVRQFSRLGAEVLVNISDDGWYGDTSAPWQHLNMARMRAVENRRWILRDTNNGTTAAIDPYGTVRSSIPRHKVDALPAGFGFNSDLTWYTVHGDVLPALCAILTVALLVWSVRSLLGEIARKSRFKPNDSRP